MNYNSLFDAYMDEVCVYVGGINGDNKFSVDHFDFCRWMTDKINRESLYHAYVALWMLIYLRQKFRV